MKVVFCGGGTGGHVYPALTAAAALRELAGRDNVSMLYVGVKGKIDAELVAREGIAFKAVSARPLRTGDFEGTARGALSAVSGTAEGVGILNGFKPDVVFATGGYGSVGVAMAAKLLQKPLLLFLPDVEAGMAVKLLARVADKIAVTVSPALDAVQREKALVTGYPVRPAFFGAGRYDSRARLGLHQELPVLLVSGASSGASAINSAVAAMAPDFLRLGQLLHLSGQPDYDSLMAQRASLPDDIRDRYHLYPYLHEDMAFAMGAADVAVMRSGASTLGELPAARLPAILVPGEYEGWDQSPNARYLESEGAAVMLPQARLADELKPAVMSLLGDSDRRSKMQEALARLARPDAALNLAQLLMKMAGAPQRAQVQG
ncbi:MAG TPA: UDP-N-acetylglucosamine--N-acetylmuramyl-(pentapeptide) pyrophosphoryl-undecaprenol N-acetylglucosamine transferase [Dehalococcoidia bacterium]|jgi:UDP-N-acetylglucosamine--N-acetylmuramyl-(pentapeptide) pyrophosphoryl-undecaprenol N-acetylglucosamine transferase